MKTAAYIALVAVIAATASTSATATAQTEHIVRAEAGIGLIIPPQTERFRNPGFALGAGYEYRFREHLGLELRYNFLGWSAKVEDGFGLTHNLAIGARFYPLPDLERGRLWLGVAPALAFTGREARFALQGGVGFEFNPSDHLLIGPMARLTWVVEPAGGALQSRDAVFLQIGISVAYTSGNNDSEQPSDTDGDGVPDDVDACPDEPEDVDGFEDEDGCPEADNDADGIPDDVDGCPTVAETTNGFEDDDGCPDELPRSDRDQDGVDDDVDACPDEPEDADGFEDEDGCPEADNDGDGMADTVDSCPNEAEVVNGIDDEDGCPDEQPRVNIEQRLLFALGATALDGRARAALRQVIQILRDNPDARVSVEGYADRVGEAADNQQLSEDRAETVRRSLVRAGVPEDRIHVVGYGESRAQGDDEDPDPDSRRVEFRVQ